MRTSLPIVALTLLLGSVCRADYIATQRYLSEGETFASNPETRILASDEALLEELWLNGVTDNRVFCYKQLKLTEYKKKRVVTMDAGLKIYKIEPLDSPPAVSVYTIQISKIGEEVISGFPTWHILLDMTPIKSAQTVGITPIHIAEWIAPTSKVPGLPSTTRNFPFMQPENVTEGKDLLNEIQGGLVVKKTVFDSVRSDASKGKAVYSEELSSFVHCELEASLFEIPGDFKAVSTAEFDKLTKKRLKDTMIPQTGGVAT